MRIALVHDYLYTFGGAERVLEAFHQIWPQAPIYTAWVDKNWLKTNKPEWQNWDIRPSWFQKIPFKKQLTSPLRFLAPQVWESFNFSDYDVVLTSAAWFITKGVITPKTTLNLCYCHTPPRYLYGYPTARDWQKNPLTRAYATLVNPFMRQYDYLSSKRVDKFICNSREVQSRIKKFYKRTATIIHPPASLDAKHLRAGPPASLDAKHLRAGPPASLSVHKSSILNHKSGNYFLMVNRLVHPKRVHLAIKAFKKLPHLNIKIVGTGPEASRLQKLATNSSNITFLGHVTDTKLHSLYANSTAVIYLADQEDFGITPIEAQSFGKAVIAANSGGIPETVINNKTGILIKSPTSKKLVSVLQNFDPTKFDSQKISDHAKQFSATNFKKKIKTFVQTEYAQFKSSLS